MNSRRSLEILFLLVVAGSLAWFVLYRTEVQKPTIERVVFVTIDTLRADHLGIDGYFRDVTPFLDPLAEDGIYFRSAYSAAPHTAPSHTTMFTSLFPFQHRARRNHEALDPGLFNMYLLTQLAGMKAKAFPAVQFLDGKVGFPANGDDPDAPQMSKRYWYRNADDIVSWTIKWLDKQREDSRHFVWLHFYDVHQWKGRGRLPKPYIERVEGLNDGPALLEFLKDQHKTSVEFFGGNDETLRAINGYDARLAFVDAQLQRLHQYLKDRKMDGNTLWVVTSDHGEGLGNHNYEGHGKLLYEEQLRVPLIFNFSEKNYISRNVNEMVRLVDLLPTIADLLGEDVSAYKSSFAGVSLYPLIERGKWLDYEVAYSFAERRPKDNESFRRTWEDGEVFSLHSKEWKLIEHTHAEDELYDRTADPFELSNIISGNPEPEGKLRTELDRMLDGRAMEEGGKSEELSPQELEELKSLGYM